MKRYIKSSFDKNIKFAPIAIYDSYIEYCYENLQGYYSEKLDDEDYKENISNIRKTFEKTFHANFENGAANTHNLGPLGTGYRNTTGYGTYSGWYAQWNNSVAGFPKRFNYIVIVPSFAHSS